MNDNGTEKTEDKPTPEGVSPRKARARHLAACCMNAIDQCVAPALQMAAFQTLEQMFENQDAEVITAEHRKAAGLPARNELGMTAEEMTAIDAAKTRLINQPLIVKAADAKPAAKTTSPFPPAKILRPNGA